MNSLRRRKIQLATAASSCIKFVPRFSVDRALVEYRILMHAHLGAQMKVLSLVCIAAGMLGSMIVPSQASPVITTPSPVNFYSSSISLVLGLTTNRYPISAPGTLSESNGAAQVGSTISLYPSPYMSISGSASSSSLLTEARAVGSVQLSYQFEFVGPTTHATIPVFVSGTGSTGGSATGQASFSSLQSSILITGPNLSAIFQEVSGTGAPGSFILDQLAGLTPNSIYTVTLNVMGSADAAIGTASFFATVDPIFTIDPTFADADQYSIFLSPNVGNVVTSVPEPPTWAMMIVGLLGIGLFARRRQPPVLTIGHNRLVT